MDHWVHTFFLETKTPTNLDIVVVDVEKVGESNMVRTIPTQTDWLTILITSYDD